MAHQRPTLWKRASYLLAGVALLGNMQPALAGGVVTSCTEAALRTALNLGGQVTFSNDCTIPISQQILINQAATTIDAQGHNVIISGSNAVSLFMAGTNLVLKGISLVNGQSTNVGGALYIQPGVTVIANQCIFAGNAASATNGVAGANAATNSVGQSGGNGANGTAGASGLGGAIYNLGELALVNCTLTNNTVSGGAGGAGGNGGSGTGTFSIPGNGGNGGAGGVGFGGAIYNQGDLTLINCTFSGNRATGGGGAAGGAGGTGSYAGLQGSGGAGGAASGGAVYNAANLTLIASTFATNGTLGGASATEGQNGNGSGLTGIKGGQGSGGALYNAWWAVVTNCTFYTNTVLGGSGGNGGAGGGTFGVPGDGGDGGDGIGGSLANANSTTIVNCTFSTGGAFGGTNGAPGSGNFTGSNGNSGNAEGGNIGTVGGTLTLLNSILTASVSGVNAFGSLVDGGHNLSSDAVSAFGGRSLQKTDPKLGTLADNGGPTLTMALLTNSPAMDQIPPEQAPATDQRGFPRPINGLSDIGAFEFGAAGSFTNITLSVAGTTNGVVQLSGTGVPGLSYVVQASTDLMTWQAISTNIAPFQFTDPTTNFPARYYRLSR